MVPDCRFGSGSGPEPKGYQMSGPGCQYTPTGISGTVQGKSHNLSELGGLSVGSPAGPSVDSFDALVSAVWKWYLPKIMYSTSSDHSLHVLQFAISIILESVVFLLYFVFLPIQAVNSSVISSNNCAMPSLPDKQDQKLMTLRWCSLSWWRNKDIMHRLAWNGDHYYLYELLPQRDT